jgi:glycosyltransferase involved in cell wall biosynthesis
VSSLPEVAGDAALLVDPYDVDALARAIVRIFTDRPLRDMLVARGLTRARQFSWADSVAAIRAVYREVLEH